MKPINLAVMLLVLSLFGNVVCADVILKARDEVQGTWKLDYSENSVHEKQPIDNNLVWIFKAGKITILQIPDEGIYYGQSPVPFDIQPPIAYFIKSGKLRIPIVDSSKFNTFAVVKIDNDVMVLRGRLKNYYYFNAFVMPPYLP